MDLGLKGRRAVVVGASRGIGWAVARRFSLEGAWVVIVARDDDVLADAARSISVETGGSVVAVAADVTDARSTDAMVTASLEWLGGVDCIVNCAATNTRSPVVPSATGADGLVDVQSKLLGYLRCVEGFLPHLVRQGSGHIVNVAGLAARQTASAVASMRSAAIVAWSKNLADELGPAGITVTAVHPGPTLTEALDAQLDALDAPARRAALDELASRVTLGRLVTADEVASAIVFLCSARGVALSGTVVECGGGVLGPIRY